jgi:hypothetical protein
MPMRIYVIPKTSLAFDDLHGKRVTFKLSGRPKHGDIDGSGKFYIIPSGKAGYLRIEIRVRVSNSDLIRIPLSRTLVQAVTKATPDVGGDYCLFFRFKPRTAK